MSESCRKLAAEIQEKLPDLVISDVEQETFTMWPYQHLFDEENYDDYVDDPNLSFLSPGDTVRVDATLMCDSEVLLTLYSLDGDECEIPVKGDRNLLAGKILNVLEYMCPKQENDYAHNIS